MIQQPVHVEILTLSDPRRWRYCKQWELQWFDERLSKVQPFLIERQSEMS
jgi:hypothetical protein